MLTRGAGMGPPKAPIRNLAQLGNCRSIPGTTDEAASTYLARRPVKHKATQRRSDSN
jgi:hypothetical protein